MGLTNASELPWHTAEPALDHHPARGHTPRQPFRHSSRTPGAQAEGPGGAWTQLEQHRRSIARRATAQNQREFPRWR